MRGKAVEDGTTRVSQNGYHYTKVDGCWRLTHHLIAEEEILGRPLEPDEMVRFIDKKTDLRKENIRVIKKGKTSLRARKAALEARIEDLQTELQYIEAQLTEEASSVD
jgi:hypothetical protein